MDWDGWERIWMEQDGLRWIAGEQDAELEPLLVMVAALARRNGRCGCGSVEALLSSEKSCFLSLVVGSLFLLLIAMVSQEFQTLSMVLSSLPSRLVYSELHLFEPRPIGLELHLSQLV